MGTCAGLCAMPTGLRRGQTLLARFGVYDERSAGLTGVGFLQNSNWGYRNQKGSWWIGFRTTRSSITGLRIWLKLKQPMVWWQSHLKKLIWPAGACWHLGPQLILGWGLLVETNQAKTYHLFHACGNLMKFALVSCSSPTRSEKHWSWFSGLHLLGSHGLVA